MIVDRVRRTQSNFQAKFTRVWTWTWSAVFVVLIIVKIIQEGHL